MFNKHVWRYKWHILAPFDRNLGRLDYAVTTGPFEKRYHYDPRPNGAAVPFCVSVTYAGRDWHRKVTPCAKHKATHLIVRPHLHREWLLPLSKTASGECEEIERFGASLSPALTGFSDIGEKRGSLTASVGFEMVLAEDEILADPDRTCQLWKEALASFFDGDDIQEAC